MIKVITIIASAALLLMAGSGRLAAQDKAAPDKAPPEKKDPTAQLEELVTKIKAQLQAGKRSEADLTEELKGFDALLKEHKGEKTDEIAEILMMKAMLYVQVFEQSEKGIALLKQLKEEFPETSPGQRVEKMIPAIEQQMAAESVRKKLVVGAVFPDWDEKDLDGNSLSIGKYKGKVVLIDFWATWCGPCIGELPNVLETYEQYHDKGFDIIGVSLDKEEEKLSSFLKQRKMTWQQFFDGKGWQNKLAVKYGINSIPATYLLDGHGKIVAKDLRGEALAREVGKLLAKE